jgi:hypothetical protein
MTTMRDTAANVAETTKDEAATVATTAADAARGVAQTAAQQTSDVVGEAARQARDLVGETRQQVREQAESQTRRLAENARALAGQLNGMAAKAEQQGPVTEVAHQIAGKIDGIAGYLDGTTPEAAIEDLRRYARRRPGMFLLGAGAVGFLAGRLLKGATAGSDDSTVTGGTTAYGFDDTAGTATGHPTAGMELGGIAPAYGGTPIPATTVDPYPTGTPTATDAALGSASYGQGQGL